MGFDTLLYTGGHQTQPFGARGTHGASVLLPVWTHFWAWFPGQIRARLASQGIGLRGQKVMGFFFCAGSKAPLFVENGPILADVGFSAWGTWPFFARRDPDRVQV